MQSLCTNLLEGLAALKPVFKDGQIVHKGDLLFAIDPRPYEIKLAQAKAALQTATARVAHHRLRLRSRRARLQ